MAMSMRDLIPWGRNRNLPSSTTGDNANPFLALHREMNRMFDDFARGFDLPMLSGGGSGDGRAVGRMSRSARPTTM